MKKISLIACVILMSASLSFAQKGKGTKVEDMQFTSTMHDYGTLEYGADGTHLFTFKNNSDKPLVISNVKSSCGCTAPTYSKEPIQPGKTGTITVKYNTNLPGAFNKTVQVFSSSENSPIRLTIMGKVMPKDGAGDKVLRGDAPAAAKTAETTAATSLEGGQKHLAEQGGDGDPMSLKNKKKELYEKKRLEAKKKK